jgi:hypothetical protein
MINMQRCIFVLFAVLLAASMGAFLLYVAVIPILVVSASVMALALSFALGAYVGREATDTHPADESTPLGSQRSRREDYRVLPSPTPH